MSLPRRSERARDIGGKIMIVVGILGVSAGILLGSLQIELVSTDGDFALCGAVWRPLLADPPAAAAACASALEQNAIAMALIGGAGLTLLVGGIGLRATVPRRLQHRP